MPPREGSTTLTNTDAPSPRPHLPYLDVDLDAINARFRAILTTRTRAEFLAALVASVVDVPPLVSEVDVLCLRLVYTRRRYANLLAAARATLAADRDGEDDALYYLRDELAEQLRRQA